MRWVYIVLLVHGFLFNPLSGSRLSAPIFCIAFASIWVLYLWAQVSDIRHIISILHISLMTRRTRTLFMSARSCGLKRLLSQIYLWMCVCVCLCMSNMYVPYTMALIGWTWICGSSRHIRLRQVAEVSIRINLNKTCGSPVLIYDMRCLRPTSLTVYVYISTKSCAFLWDIHIERERYIKISFEWSGDGDGVGRSFHLAGGAIIFQLTTFRYEL